MIETLVTAASNGATMGYFAFVAGLAIWLRRDHADDHPAVHQSAGWVIVSALAWIAFRGLWNLALATDGPDTPGPYAAWALETRHYWTVALISVVIYSGWRVIRPWFDDNTRGKAGMLLTASVVMQAALWATLVWWLQG